MRTLKSISRLINLLIFIVAVPAANAAVTVYTDKAAFMARLDWFVIETFDDIPYNSNSGALVGPQFVRTVGPYTYEARGTYHGVHFGGSPSDVWMHDSPFFGASSLGLGFTLGSPVAIGGDFFASGVTSPVPVIVTVGATGPEGGTSSQVPLGSAFLGFVADGGQTLTGVSLTIPFAGQPLPYGIATMNNLIFGTVPEPATPLLMLLGCIYFALACQPLNSKASEA